MKAELLKNIWHGYMHEKGAIVETLEGYDWKDQDVKDEHGCGYSWWVDNGDKICAWNCEVKILEEVTA